jgi:halogenation protein CepH
MSHQPAERFDVVVVGGGPGGSTISSLVAMEGHRVVLLEKEQFPRYQIGESLLPATIHGICPMLGVADEVKNAGFMVKRGGTFKWGSNPDPWTFSFAISRHLAGPTSFAYQVERMKFDTILLDNARRLGVDVRQNSTVSGVERDEPGRVRGVHYLDELGNPRRAWARFVVDASGHTSRLHTEVGGKREYSPLFKNLAVFGYFEGGRRLPEPNSGNILSVAFDDGWFWYIPLSPTLTSVGAVIHRELAAKLRGDPESALQGLINECPLIADYLGNARRVTDGPYGSVRIRTDYSYSRERFWAPGLALVGDAACFIDPVFSSGVHLATYSALLAARSINSVLAGTVSATRSFGEFEARYRREFDLFHDFLTGFYDMHVDEQSYFWHARKVTDHDGTDLEAFLDLIGGVASDDFLFEGEGSRGGDGDGDGARRLGRISATAKAISAAVSATDAAGDGDVEVMVDGSSVFREMLAEGAGLSARAALGFRAMAENPLFEGGLVPSANGRRWTEAR